MTTGHHGCTKAEIRRLTLERRLSLAARWYPPAAPSHRAHAAQRTRPTTLPPSAPDPRRCPHSTHPDPAPITPPHAGHTSPRGTHLTTRNHPTTGNRRHHTAPHHGEPPHHRNRPHRAAPNPTMGNHPTTGTGPAGETHPNHAKPTRHAKPTHRVGMPPAPHSSCGLAPVTWRAWTLICAESVP